MRDYVDCFSTESTIVKDVSNDMKRYLFEQGLHEGSLLWQEIRLRKGNYVNEILRRAESFIIYEDDLKADKIIEKTLGDNQQQREDRSRKDRERDPSASGGRTGSYMPLNTSRNRILEQCINVEFQDPGVRWPKPKQDNLNADKNKYCKFHKACGHYTED